MPLHSRHNGPSGTLWIVSDEDGHFHREHARAMTELASFVAIALRTLEGDKQYQRALDEQRLLAREMSHRINNLFAMADGLIRLSAKEAASTAEMSALLSGRLHAFANAHSLVRREFTELGTGGPTSDLKELMRKIVLPHERDTSEGASRFSIKGPRVRCDERGTNGIALIFHELATNAAKHGALMIDSGRVEIDWSRQNDQLTINWVEREGPAVEGPPSKNGFGDELVRRMAEQFGGTLDYDWRRDGLAVTHITCEGHRKQRCLRACLINA